MDQKVSATHSAYIILILADGAEPLIEQSSYSGPAVFLTC